MRKNAKKQTPVEWEKRHTKGVWEKSHTNTGREEKRKTHTTGVGETTGLGENAKWGKIAKRTQMEWDKNAHQWMVGEKRIPVE